MGGRSPLSMDEILHHFEAMRNRCLLVFAGESSFQGFLGGAGVRPLTAGTGYTLRHTHVFVPTV